MVGLARILSLSVDGETLRMLERLEGAMHFGSRSETLRAAVRSLGAELEELEGLSGVSTAVAVAVHDDSRDSELDALKHEFEDIVATQLHNSFSGSCVELFVLNGPAARIAAFAKTLKARPHLAYARLVSPNTGRRRARS